MPVQRPYNPNAKLMAEMLQSDWAKASNSNGATEHRPLAADGFIGLQRELLTGTAWLERGGASPSVAPETEDKTEAGDEA